MKVIDSLTYIWQFALIASEQIYNAFVITVKTMINYILSLVNWTIEDITFCHIHAYLKTLTITFNNPSDFCPDQMTAQISRFPKWNHGIRSKCFLTSSFIYRRCKCLLRTLTKSLSSGWYVITRGIPFVLVLLFPEVLKNLTLLTSVSIIVLGYRLFEKLDFISFQCLIKPFSNEHILLTRRAWL